MKFIFNFVVFGAMFYLIHKFVPGFFDQMVGWGDQAFSYVEGLYQKGIEMLKSTQ